MAKDIQQKVGDLTIYADGTFKIANCIAIYPTVIHAKKILDNPKPKFSVSVLLDSVKQAKEIEAFRAFIKKAAKDGNLGALASDKLCFRDGADLGKEALEPYWRLTMSSNADRPPVLRYNGEKKSRAEDSDELEELAVTGAKVQVLGSLYLQSNSFAKRVNCNIEAINFTGDAINIEIGAGSKDSDDVWDDDEDL